MIIIKLIQFICSDCKLMIPDNPEQYKNSFKKLQHLFLCRTPYKWEDIIKAALMWPHIETLKVKFDLFFIIFFLNNITIVIYRINFQIPFSKIETLEAPINVLQNIVHLDIQGNKIFKWSEINKLGHLPV